jgi:lipopolysaccharide transport system permease protein
MQITVLNDIKNHSDLLLAWTSRTIRARYQQSVLGILWAIAQPLAMMFVFTILFTRIIPVDTGGIPYVVFSYSALVPWTLFLTSVTDMIESLVANMNLVSKIYFPRDILVISVMMARLLDFSIASSILLLLLLYYHLPVFTKEWLFLPLILLIQLCLSLGLGLFGSATNVFLRDVRHLFALILQLWFYATPIIYPVTMIPENLRPFYYLNPMAGVITAYRSVLIYQTPPDTYLVLSGIVSVLVLIIGYLVFKRLEPNFADVV